MNTVGVGESVTSVDDQRDLLRAADPDRRRELLRAYVRRLCSEVLTEWSPETGDDEVLFFESIAAAEFKAVVERDLEVTIPFTDLVEEPTVAGLADLFASCLDDTEIGGPGPRAGAGGTGTAGTGVLTPDPANRFAAFGLTDVQHAYWLGRSGLFELGGVSAHLYVEFESVGFDVARAEWAFRVLVDRHDMLRAVVRSDGRQQVLESVPPFVVEVEDLSGLGEVDALVRVAGVRDRLSHEVRPADVWPLFGVVAQCLSGGRWRVHVSFDLLIADAGSIQLLLEEWVGLYVEPERVLAPVGLTFRDYVGALERVTESEAFDRAREYWMGRLATLPPAPELPMVAGAASDRFVRREFLLSRDRWQAIRATAMANGVTPSVVVAGVYAEVLAAWAKSRWFTLNLTVGDRLPVHPDVSRVLGDFTSLVLLEVDFRGSAGFVDRLVGLQRQLWRDLEHRAFGGVRVLRELARVFGVGRASMPVVFTSVVGREFGGVGGVLPGLGRMVSGVSQTPQVFLDHQIYERVDGLVVSWDAVEGLFPVGVLDVAFGEFRRVLERLADDPEAWHLERLAELPEEYRPRWDTDDNPAGGSTAGAVGTTPTGRTPAIGTAQAAGTGPHVAPNARPARTPTPPVTPAERILADIWANLLGLESVSTTDNLFELGADSLLALRAVTDADAHGLKIDLRDVFVSPTIREQSARARAVAGAPTRADAPVTGPSPLTPSQHWFLSQDLPQRHHWNDASFLLSLQRPLDLDLLRRSLRQILEHHDALRMRFHDDGDTWRGDITATDEIGELPFSVYDFATLSGPQQKKAVTEVADALQRSLNLADGPLIRVAYFDLGKRPHCMLLLAHWLVVDHYSSRVLLEDLLSCYRQYDEGTASATLPGRTTPFPVWAAALTERARGPELAAQLPYWTDPARRDLTPLYLDEPTGANTLESLETITLRLDHDVTEAVLRSVPRAFDTDIATVLCTALVRSLPVRTAGERRMLIDLERHGRDLDLAGHDIGRTVGRFSTIAPVLLELDQRADVAEALAAVGRQLAAVPGQGHGYGMLRYLSEHADELARMPSAQAGLNYVGQVDELFLRSDLLSVPRMSYGEQRSRVGTRFRPLDVLGYVVGRRLSFTIGYSTNLHSAATAESFAAEFRKELEHLATRAEQR